MNPLDWLAHPELTALAAALLHFLWQGSLIALLASAAMRLPTFQRPGERYACALMTLMTMAACPPVTYLIVAATARAAPAVGLGEGDTIVLTNPVIDSGREQSLLPGVQQLVSRLQPYLLALWLAGVSALGVRLACGAIGIVRLSRNRRPATGDLARCLERLGRVMRIDALSRVFLSERVSEALVIGFCRPIVLVPAAWASDMPLSVLEAIIAHELAHIRRHDLWVNLLARLVETILFYHPAVWWIARELRQAREMCCDEWAVRATGQKVAYVEALELVARERLAGVRPLLAAGISGEANMKLLARVRNVLSGPAGEAGHPWLAGVLALLLPLGLWGVTWTIFAATPTVAAADDDDDDDDKAERRKEERREDEDDERSDNARKEREADKRDDDDREEKEPAVRKVKKPQGEAIKKESRDGEEPRKEPIKKEVRRKEGGPAVKKVAEQEERPRKDSPKDQPRFDGREREELAELVRDLRAENERLRAELEALRRDLAVKIAGDDAPHRKAAKADVDVLIERLREAELAAARNQKEALVREQQAAEKKAMAAALDKKHAAEREGAERKKAEAEKREAVAKKELEAARAKAEAAKREAAVRKERDARERDAIERKLKDAAERKLKEREDIRAVETKEKEGAPEKDE